MYKLIVFFLTGVVILNLKTTAQVNINSTLPPKTATTLKLKTPVGVIGQSNGIKCNNIIVKVDTSIRVAPTYAYLAIDFTEVTGSNQIDILNGTHLFWIFDPAGKEVKLPLKVLSSVKAAMESSGIVDLKVRIPYRLKTDKNNYTIHYRWESKDKSRNMDFLTTK